MQDITCPYYIKLQQTITICQKKGYFSFTKKNSLQDMEAFGYFYFDLNFPLINT